MTNPPFVSGWPRIPAAGRGRAASTTRRSSPARFDTTTTTTVDDELHSRVIRGRRRPEGRLRALSPKIPFLSLSRGRLRALSPKRLLLSLDLAPRSAG